MVGDCRSTPSSNWPWSILLQTKYLQCLTCNDYWGQSEIGFFHSRREASLVMCLTIYLCSRLFIHFLCRSFGQINWTIRNCIMEKMRQSDFFWTLCFGTWLFLLAHCLEASANQSLSLAAKMTSQIWVRCSVIFPCDLSNFWHSHTTKTCHSRHTPNHTSCFWPLCPHL